MAEEGAPVSSLGGILGVVMIVVVVLGLLFYGFINAEAFSWENIMRLAPTLYLPVESEELGSVQEPVFSGDVDSERAPHLTATRVGCEIAKKIRDDYAVHGDADRTERENILDGAGEKKLRFVNSGKFRLEWNAEKNRYWNFVDLSLQAQEKIKSDCRDTSAGFTSCADRLDEACITAIFKYLKVPSGQNLCGSFAVGTNNVNFGNKECGEAVIRDSEGTAWVECSGLCPDSDKLTFKATSAETPPNFPGLSFSEEQIVVNDNLGQNKFPPECSSNGCQPEYVYTIFWDRQRKIYDVRVRKVPAQKDFADMSAENAAEIIAKIFKTEDRNGAEGAKLPEARLKADFTFSPFRFPVGKPEYFLSDFANDILEKLNFGEEKRWVVKYEDCSGDECFSSKPEAKVNYMNRVEYNPEPGQTEVGVRKNPSEKEVFKNRRVIKIRTNMKDEKLEADKTYRVLIYKWIRETGEKEKVPRCDCGFAKQNTLSQPVWCPKEDSWQCECAVGLGFGPLTAADLLRVCGIEKGAYFAEGYSQYKLYATIDYTIVIVDKKSKGSATSDQTPGLGADLGSTSLEANKASSQKPDLSPRISVSGAADPNKIKINIQIINSGLGSSKAGAFNFQIANANGEEVRAETLSMPAIAAGDVHTETWPVDYSHAAGTYKLTFNVDVHEDNDESDETNNRAQDVYTMPLR